MKQIKKLFAFLLTGILFTTLPTTAIAADKIGSSNTVAEYSLYSNEPQTFYFTDEDNNPYYITITPEPNTLRLANGNYKITHTIPNCWSASFIINVSSNKIVSVDHPSVLTSNGYATDISLRKVSSTEASLRFLYHVLMFPEPAGVRAYISNNSIFVQKI